MKFYRLFVQWMIMPTLLLSSCAVISEDATKKKPPLGLITTPPSYYSTPKGRYLGGKYKANLDRLVERIVRNPKTANLQFANNIAGLGGIGFFTHSETKTSDERYLEVIVGTPETFESKGDVSTKIARLFGLYGADLLSILLSDSDIFLEKEVAGYGLNFAWRTFAQSPSTSRVALERAVVYFPKEKVKGFLKQEINRDTFLAEAVIFTAEEDGPMNLVSFRPQVLKSDSRSPIMEETLALPREASIPSIAQPPLQKSDSPMAETTSPEGAQQLALREKPPAPPPQPPRVEPKTEVEAVRNTEVGARALPENPVAPPEARAKATPAEEKQEVGKGVPERDHVPDMDKMEDGDGKLETVAQVAVEQDQKRDMTLQPAKKVESRPEPKDAEQRAPVTLERLPDPVAPPAMVEKQGERIHEADKTDRTAVADATFPPGQTVSKPQAVIKPPAEVASAETQAASEARPGMAAKLEASPPKENETPVNEQIALFRSRPSEPLPPRKAWIRPAPRTLEGFVIQIAFSDKTVAQRWAETFGRRGYAVSVTEIGGSESFRLRLGNFAVRDEAERQLRQLREEGLKGIVINLPQGYKPDAVAPNQDQNDQSAAVPR